MYLRRFSKPQDGPHERQGGSSTAEDKLWQSRESRRITVRLTVLQVCAVVVFVRSPSAFWLLHSVQHAKSGDCGEQHQRTLSLRAPRWPSTTATDGAGRNRIPSPSRSSANTQDWMHGPACRRSPARTEHSMRLSRDIAAADTDDRVRLRRVPRAGCCDHARRLDSIARRGRREVPTLRTLPWRRSSRYVGRCKTHWWRRHHPQERGHRRPVGTREDLHGLLRGSRQVGGVPQPRP